MTEQHSITPPDELVMKWWDDGPIGDHIGLARYMADQASRWGSDQELEACVEWMNHNCPNVGSHHLTAARRPKQLSLKEQALLAIDTAVADGRLSPDVSNVVRRALEAVPDD